MTLESDEEMHKKFEKADAILQMQSNGEEALMDRFGCFKAGYNRGKYEERQKFIAMLKERIKTEIPNEKSPSYNGLYAEDKRLYERLIKIIENERVD